ncbi:hypothetical protein SK128_027072 [Halocaridina rubra]|uniref:RING-type domain-containing protein n=1 Tax=Halocaridina rubra TaxID=373956 RepID=A0AAN8X795_HALRR
MPALECDICLELFNEVNRIPRCLSCSHVLCTSCIIQLVRNGPLRCPFCRSLHNREVISSVDIPVHSVLMSLVAENSERRNSETLDESRHVEQVWLNVTKLRSDIQKADEEGNTVYASLVNADGQTRCAQVTLRDDRIHLHALKDGHPPEGSHVVAYEKIRALADETYVVTFLEISFSGVVQGYVYIRLLDDAGRTQQFLYFCTGEKGPSYANTCFFEVTNKGSPGEQLWGGDYENNDGSGGAALPNMQCGPKNYQDITAGLVAGFYFSGYGQDHNPSQFGIYTNNMIGYSEMSSLGKVVIGLEIVSNAAQLEDVQEAIVSSCGIVLFH